MASFRARTALWMGRDPTCHVLLASDRVSRRHVSVERRGNELVVTDASANGTLVTGTLLRGESRGIGAGAELQVGPFTVRVAALSLPLGPGAPVGGEVRRKIHGRLLERVDLRRVGPGRAPAELRNEVRAALARLVGEMATELPPDIEPEELVDALLDEALGLGPLEPLLSDPSVTEILVVDPATIFVERSGRLERTPRAFTDAESVRAVIERIVTPLGRRLDESSPLVDARLPDGSRVNAIIPPLAVRGPCITIRKWRARPLELSELVRMGALTERMARFVERCVRVRKNLLISGGTGSGKTTLLNALSSAIPESERIVTVEDAAELKLSQEHVVTLEARAPNMEGKGAVTIRDLVRNALRMRPDRIVVGECRGGEALDMLQAMNTGHDGSMTTVHANSPREAVARLETLCLMSGLELPLAAIRHQIASSVHVVVQTARFSDGTRRVTSIAEVAGGTPGGEPRVEEVFRFERAGVGRNGIVEGHFSTTGYVPTFIDAFVTSGVAEEGEYL